MSSASLRTKLIYSTGDLTVAVPLSIINFFQLYFLTDVAGLPPAYAGWALLIGKIWDAVNDPLIGVMVDRISHPFGRRRLLMLLGALPLGVGFFLMWLVPPLSPLLLILYYAGTIILFDSGFTLVHIGYNALTPSLTSDYSERSGLNGIRMSFQLIGSIGAIVVLTLLAGGAADEGELYRRMGLILALAAVVPVAFVLGVTAPFKETEASGLSPRESMAATLRCRPFRLFVVLYLLVWTTASVMSSTLVYFARYYLTVPHLANYMVLTAQCSAILFIPSVVGISTRLGKHRALIVGSFCWLIALIGICLLPAAAVPAAFALAGACGFGIATAYVVPWSMLPDIIEHDAVVTGFRREGAFYSFAAFFQKLGTALAVWLMGQMLQLSGYRSGADLAGELLPESAVATIRLFMGPLPALLLLTAIILALRYPITREVHEENLRRLRAMEASI